MRCFVAVGAAVRRRRRPRLTSVTFVSFVFAVEWYEKYRLDPPADPPMDAAADLMEGDTAEMVAEYERILLEYLEMFADDTAAAAMDGFLDETTGETYYEKDDGYEGDLHMSIGSLYMARSDNSESIQAASHLEQAVRLYELSGEVQSQNMATVKFNLSILHLRNGDYPMSARLHGEALDIFRAVIGDGVNPMAMGDEELNSLLLMQQEQEESYFQATRTSKTTTTTSPQTKGSKAPSVQATKTAGGGGGGGGPPTILVDVQRFLSQNDSLREEL